MPMPFRPEREAPPTAGLPLGLSDLTGGVPAPLTALAATWLGVEQVQLECSGTSALTIALATLHEHARSRNEVAIPAFTCPLVPLAIRRAGLVPRVVDVKPGHFDMDPQRLAEACNERTLAVVPTHLGGRTADVAVANVIAHAVGASTVEDAAQALGARIGGRFAGTHGDVPERLRRIDPLVELDEHDRVEADGARHRMGANRLGWWRREGPRRRLGQLRAARRGRADGDRHLVAGRHREAPLRLEQHGFRADPPPLPRR